MERAGAEYPESNDSEPRRRFLTTRWSVVLAARTGESHPALAELCETYWYPIYAFIRRSGNDADQARDLTQEFFATLLEKGYLQRVDPRRGRFRTFLLVVVERFLANRRRAERTLKSGGGRMPLSLDFVVGERQYANEPATERTAQQIFERRWALTLLERVLERLEQEYREKGKEALAVELRSYLTADLEASSYVEMASRLGMSVGAVKTAAFRYRQRYRELLYDEVAQTVAEGESIEDELRYLREVVSRG
jgi:RNA polymerase sigma factor (sigma-70 family)